MYSESEDENNDGDLLTTKSPRKRKLLVYSDEEDSSGESDTDDNNSDDLEESEGQCSICLTEFTDQMVAVPKTCNHVFCLDCLQEWAKKINNCPVDRTKFNFILAYKIKDGPLVKEIYVEDKDIKDDEVEDPPTYCEVCGSCEREDSLLLCDECDNGYHLDCLVPPLLFVPYDEWFCSNCQPEDHALEVNLSKASDFIGNEEMLMKIYEDHCASDFINEISDSGANEASDSRVNKTSDSRVRTVAKVKNERRQNRRLERSQSSRSRRPRSKNSMQRKRRRKMRRAAKRMNKELSSKIKEKANKEKLKKEVEDNDTVISIYGDQYDLNEFHEVSDEENEPIVKHNVTQTADVVGSILSGFVTLDPNKVVVERDGSLKEKIYMEKALIATVSGVTVSRRKKTIRFIDEDDDVDTNKIEKHKSTEECIFSPPKKSSEVGTCSEINNSQDIDFSGCSTKQTKREILSGQLLKFKSDIDLDKKIKKQLAEMRQKSNKKEFKSMASLHSISGFKIPKKIHTESHSLIHQADDCPLDSSLDHHAGDCSKVNPSATLLKKVIQVKASETHVPNDFRKPIEKKQVLTLEKKIELYNQGKYKKTHTKNRAEIIKDTKERCLALMRGKNQDSEADASNPNELKSSKILKQNKKLFLGNESLNISNSNENNQLRKNIDDKNNKNNILTNSLPLKMPVKVSFAEYKKKTQQEKEKKSLFTNDANACFQDDSKKNLFEELFGDPNISFLEETKEPCSNLLKINFSDTPSLNSSESPDKKLFETQKSNLSSSSNLACSSNLSRSSKLSCFFDCRDKINNFPIQTDSYKKKRPIVADRSDIVSHVTVSPCQNISSSDIDKNKTNNNLYQIFSPNGEDGEPAINNSLLLNKPLAIDEPHIDIKSEVNGKLVNSCGIPIAIVHPRSISEEHFTMNNVSSAVNVEKKQEADSVNQKKQEADSVNQKVPPIDKFYLEKIKALLKRDYKKGKLTKDQWKDIVKKSVKKIQCNVAYYKKDGTIENLVQSFLKKTKENALFETMMPGFV